MSLAERVTIRRRHLGLTQSDLAKMIGVSQQAVERIESGATKSPRKIVFLASALQVRPEWLISGEGAQQGAPETLGQSTPDFPLAVASSSQKPIRDLPVLGRAQGGSDGALVMEDGPIDWTYRPPALDRVDDAFAVFVTGESMEPRYFAGDILYVHPSKPIRSGRHILIETRGHEGLIKRFDRWTDDELHLTQYNPAQTLSLKKSDVLRIMLVVGAMEEG